jgi:FtsP/CotA-like multicopper oxidase with cupredoxin domain
MRFFSTSSDIVKRMLSEAGYAGTPAAPGANSALINGVGEWNCSLATRTQRCEQVASPPEFIIAAGEKIRFRLINAGVHAMFFYSVDEHTLNITEADSTGIYGRTFAQSCTLYFFQSSQVSQFCTFRILTDRPPLFPQLLTFGRFGFIMGNDTQ